MSLFYREACAAEMERRADRIIDGGAAWTEKKDLEEVVGKLRSAAKLCREGSP